MLFTGTSWKTRFQLQGRCPLEPGEVVPVVKSQELVQGLTYLEGSLWVGLGPGRRTEPVRKKKAQKWVGPKRGVLETVIDLCLPARLYLLWGLWLLTMSW